MVNIVFVFYSPARACAAVSQPQIVYEGKTTKSLCRWMHFFFFFCRTAWCSVSYLQLCNLTKVHRITRVVRHRVTCTVLHHVCFFFFLSLSCICFCHLGVIFRTLKPVALSLFVTVLLLYTVFFCLCPLLFYSETCPPNVIITELCGQCF